MPAFRSYTSNDDDNLRWAGFPFREGDIVVSTRSKAGTTWVQMIVLLLVHGTPELPGRLVEMSPWLDHSIEPVDDVIASLQAQPFRRVIKTHTPLDGLPLDPRATYVVVGRHPLDMAVSMYHHRQNIDRARVAELTGRPQHAAAPPPLHQWLAEWATADNDPVTSLDSLPGVLHHATDAWRRTGATPRVLLVHYADLVADLEGQMRSLSRELGTDIPEDDWPALVKAASFPSMRADADKLAPTKLGVLKDETAFFRSGRSGEGEQLLGETGLAAYRRHVATLAPAEVVEWLHR